MPEFTPHQWPPNYLHDLTVEGDEPIPEASIESDTKTNANKLGILRKVSQFAGNLAVLSVLSVAYTGVLAYRAVGKGVDAYADNIRLQEADRQAGYDSGNLWNRMTSSLRRRPLNLRPRQQTWSEKFLAINQGRRNKS